MDKIDFKNRTVRKIPYVGGEPVPGTLVEMVYQPEAEKTLFAIWNGTEVRYEPEFPLADNQALVPYSPNNNLVRNKVILFPAAAEEYDTEGKLIGEIRNFIHRYVDLSKLFETVATYYVLLSWIYESFNEIPYIRVRGDPGSGKTRFLLIAGSLCFRPVFGSGASTISPVFRILDSFRGTLIIDEGDFRMSDEKVELVKILNNGNARGFPVLRSEQSISKKEFNPVAYSVFGPKIVASRGFFEDRALESRFITEETGGKLRTDIPINLPSSYQQEALRLRNKLLSFRFRNLNRQWNTEQVIDRSIEPRLNQIFSPLMSIVKDETVRQQLSDLARTYNREIVTDREMDVEAQVLQVIRELLNQNLASKLSMGEIANAFMERFGQEYERPVTSKWIGTVVRKRLKLKTQKSHGVFVIPHTEESRLKMLFERYGVEGQAA